MTVLVLIIAAVIGFLFLLYKATRRPQCMHMDDIEPEPEDFFLPDRISRDDQDPRAKAIFAAFDSGRPVMWTEKDGMKFVDGKGK